MIKKKFNNNNILKFNIKIYKHSCKNKSEL